MKYLKTFENSKSYTELTQFDNEIGHKTGTEFSKIEIKQIGDIIDSIFVRHGAYVRGSGIEFTFGSGSSN